MTLVDSVNQKKFNIDEPIWIAPNGGLLDINFEAKFDLKKIKNAYPNLWRYADAIAIDQSKGIISFNEGFTPIEKILIKNRTIFIKQEQLFTTGSYKDRGATTLISKAKQLGITKVVQDSSGNAGCAIAAYAAKAKITCEIFLPENTSVSKISQMQAYGATITKVLGVRKDAANAALIAAKTNYYASHCYNPWFFEGTKTFAFEICEQLHWENPEYVVLPAGNGTLIIGCYIGFNQLAKAGIISKIPKLIAVQTEVCAPLYHTFFNKIAVTPFTNITVAEGIAIENPPRGNQILEAITKTNGTFITVNELEIKSAWKQMALLGNYIEPTSAATIAGVEKFITNYDTDNKTIVSLFSGHGLKSKNLF
jgi:threonine synthase